MAGRPKANLFYRIETEAQRGPYRGGNNPGINQAFTQRHNLFNRPSPLFDHDIRSTWNSLGNAGREHHYRFGFKTETQMRKWFTPAVMKRVANSESGSLFFVSVYRGECHSGKRQAFARLDEMELVSRTKLNQYICGAKLIKKGIAAPEPAISVPKMDSDIYKSDFVYPMGWAECARRLLGLSVDFDKSTRNPFAPNHN